MSNFEKVIRMDPSRDEGQGYEKPLRIEKTDAEFFMPKQMDLIDQINKESRENDEKSKSKKTKGRPKKNNAKLHWSTVEGV